MPKPKKDKDKGKTITEASNTPLKPKGLTLIKS